MKLIYIIIGLSVALFFAGQLALNLYGTVRDLRGEMRQIQASVQASSEALISLNSEIEKSRTETVNLQTRLRRLGNETPATQEHLYIPVPPDLGSLLNEARSAAGAASNSM